MRDEPAEATEALSAWLDGELSEAEAAELERRLADDPRLAALRDEIEGVRDAAAALSPVPPDRDLWPGIEARIRSGRIGTARSGPRKRTLALTLPQLAAAAVVLLAAGGGATWLVRQAADGEAGPGRAALVAPEGPEAAGARLAVSGAPAGKGSRTSDDAIAQLETRLAEGRGRLNSSTVRVLEESLETIDRAIAQAARALAEDPGNAWLNRHLADAKARKVRLLERANALAAPTT